MSLLHTVIRQLSWINEYLLRAGRAVGILAIGVMVCVTIAQVIARYGLNSALAWPDEAARFCMLWMTGLMAPTAFRRGGFVAIDMIPAMLPATLARILNLLLLCLSLLVMIVAVQIGWREVTGLGGRFASASLFLPTSLDFSTWYRIPRAWMMASIPVGLVLLISVNVELILRTLADLVGVRDLPPIEGLDPGLRGAE
ncbi:TRAP transporter small permease [Paracoccus nototheniae]|uniref:TRAP transporter small permease protein n=1 Tax=Paracoccus nototheniae TaxID=2489002 RepID=A0ABW4DT61_9RHOB|nr:TRAP transporter small permease subunit [Paracoccus nototheniae]